jgi:YesN/AraC family two-component response regulator
MHDSAATAYQALAPPAPQQTTKQMGVRQTLIRSRGDTEHPIRLLWLDLTVALEHSELPAAIRERCTATHSKSEADARARCDEGGVDVTCIDYDYPDRSGLRTLQNLKSAFPSIPIVVLTLQHSESLAVWAFRSGVRDFLVKPVSANEIARCFDTLTEVLKSERQQRHRAPVIPARRIPDEASAPVPQDNEIALAPAINYVEQHFRAKILIDHVAPLCGMSPFRFSRTFKSAYQIGFGEYVLQYRLREACRMLQRPNAVVTDVCYAVGFNDASYFTRMFRKYFNVVPSAIVGSTVTPNGQTL